MAWTVSFDLRLTCIWCVLYFRISALMVEFITAVWKSLFAGAEFI